MQFYRSDYLLMPAYKNVKGTNTNFQHKPTIRETKINDCFYLDVTRDEESLDTLHYLTQK